MFYEFDKTAWKKSYWVVGDPMVYMSAKKGNRIGFNYVGIRSADQYFELYNNMPSDNQLNDAGILYKKSIEQIIDTCIITDEILEGLSYV